MPAMRSSFTVAICLAALLGVGLSGCGEKTMKSIETSFKKIDPALGEIEVFEGRYLDYLLQEGLQPVRAAVLPAEATKGYAAAGTDPNLIERPQVANDGIVHSPAITALVETLAGEVLAHWPGDKPKITYRIVDNRAYNARAYGSHEVFVNLGAIERAGSEGELKVLLGHEVAHVVLNHFYDSELIKRQKEFVGLVTQASTTSTVMDDVSGVRLATAAAAASNDDVRRSLALAFAADKFASWVVGPAWDRREEGQADLLGMDLAVRAGADDGHILAFIRRLTESLEQREFALDEYKKEADAFVKEADGNPGELVVGAPSFLYGGVIAGFSDFYDRVTSDYVEPAKRKGAVETYIAREIQAAASSQAQTTSLAGLFSGGSTPTRSSDRLDRLKQSSEYKGVIAAYDMVQAVEKAGAEGGSLTSLAARGGAALDTVAGNDPNVRLAMYRIREAQGRGDAAVTNLERANRDGGAPVRYYTTLAKIYAEQGKTDLALDVLDIGVRGVATAWPFFLTRIDVLMAGGRKDEARKTAELCIRVAATFEEDPGDKSERSQLGETCGQRFAELSTRALGS